MPTNLIRGRPKPARPPAARTAGGPPRRVLIRAGRISLRAELSATADRIWAALPFHSTAETWGQAVQFETPVETGAIRPRGSSRASATSVFVPRMIAY